MDLAQLYDLQGLDAEGRRLAAWIRRRIAGVDSPRSAFVERLRVGGRVAQFIGHDPRVPAALWGKRRGLLESIDEFQRFEQQVVPQARQFLRETMARHRVIHSQK